MAGRLSTVPSNYFPRSAVESTLPYRDRATYDALLTTAVNYSVSSPLDAPLSLTYGPSFFTLAGVLAGDVTIGLNRELNNIENTRSAAEAAVQRVKGLLAIELGNEPDRAFHKLDSHASQTEKYNFDSSLLYQFTDC